MFGTLVICLPSKHTGGEVLATHCGYTKTFETATSSQFGFSCVSWYADVTHEIKPVTSGYRFVLTYNLIHTVDGSFQSTSDLKDQNMRLGRSLTFWNTLIDKNYDVPVRLAFKLSHKYTQASLCLDNLKGHDLMRVNMLKDCCAEGKFFIYLANLERRRFGSCHEGYYPDVYPDDPDAEESIHGDFHKLQEVFDDDLTLNTVIDLSGSVIAEEICFEENDIMQANLFSEGPQEEDYSGFTGNEGVSATHWYRHTVAVLVPRDFRLSFLFEPATRGKLDAKVWLQNQLQEVQENPSDESVKKETLRLCELMLQNNQHIHSEKLKRAKENSTYFSEKKLFSDDVLAMVVKIAISLHRWSLLPKVLPALSDRLPPWIFNDIGKNLHVLSFPSQRGWLNEVIRSQKRLHDRHQALENLVSSFRSALTTEQGSTQLSILQAWQKEQSDDVLDTAEISGKADAQALFDIAALYGDKVMFQQILPIVKKHVSDMNFAVTFLLCLDISGQRHSLSKEVRETVFRDILSDIIPVFTLQDQAPSHKRSRFTYSASGLNSTLPRGADRPSESVSASDLVNLLEMCMILGLEGEIDQIFKRLKSEATTVDVSALGKIYIPLLGQLAEVIRKRQHPLTETYRDFYRHSVESYILRFVGIEPAYPVDWKRDRRGCGCWECKDLDTFLLNPAEPSAKFSTNLRRRNHLANRLGGTYNNKNYPMTTETAGSPHTLVVYKTDNEWKSAVSAWKKRFKTASLQLRAMHHETSKQLLGEKYEELFELRMVRLDRDTTSSAALGQE
ncbi:MAG: hypothetical protein M1837_003436 [Sclerophora amabilis]|nr:MAG: hypothetical protein M1837_003436 [Sclerophora amabilis]